MFQKLHSWLGDFWWYSLMLFAAQRIGDVINVFVGLWLVPKYVPMEELGVVLPLTQAVGFVGIPLAIVSTPFMKFLASYASRGELGKVKSLLRDVFALTAVMACVTFLLAFLVLPHFFERMRVPAGSLGLLIVVVCILSAVSTIFANAVQGLGLYSSTVVINLLGAPARLLAMILFIPFRPLSGYMVGQGASPAVSIVGSLWALRKHFSRSVKALPYWREDGAGILKYVLLFAVMTTVVTATNTVDTLVIRHRLSDFESAGYYLITRFTDISSYLGGALTAFLFPMVANKAAHGTDSRKLLSHSLWGIFASTFGVGLLLFAFGDFILSLQSLWSPYRPLVGHMFWVCLMNAFVLANGCLSTYEIAQGRFGFLWYYLAFNALKTVLVYCVTGYTFFEGILPRTVMDAIAAFGPCRLSFVVGAFLIFQAMLFTVFCMDVFRPWKKEACHAGR